MGRIIGARLQASAKSRETLLDRLQKTLDKLTNLDQLEEAVKAVEKAVADRETRQPALIRQLAFYFSDANLRRDRFLREKIVSADDGFVPISVILPFNRLKLMGCSTPEEISSAVEAADPKFNLELSEKRDALRRAGNAEPPPLSFGGAGSDFEKRSVQLSGFPKGESITIEEVTALVERFGSVAFVRLLREPGPSAGGPNPFAGTVEIEFQAEEAATAVVALEEPLSWKGTPLEPAKQLSELRRTREETAPKRKNESMEENPEEKRRRVEDEAAEVAKNWERGMVLRFDEFPSTLHWRDFKEGLRSYGGAKFVSLKNGSALVQMRDEDGIFAVMGCAKEDEGFLCVQCYPRKRDRTPRGEAEEAEDDEEKGDAEDEEDLPLAEMLKPDAQGDAPEGDAPEDAAAPDAPKEPEVKESEKAKDIKAEALGPGEDDDSVRESVTFRLPVRQVSGDEEEEFLKLAATAWLQQKGSLKGKGKGKKGKGKDGKGKSKGKGKGKKGKGKGKDR